MCLCVCARGCGPSGADTIDLNVMKLLMRVKWLRAGSHGGAASSRLDTRDFAAWFSGRRSDVAAVWSADAEHKLTSPSFPLAKDETCTGTSLWM